jgi:hypothetical protein
MGAIACLALALAGGLKLFAFATRVTSGGWVWVFAEIGWAQAELMIAFVAVTARANVARKFLLGVYLVFCVVSFVGLSAGRPSCGCFGALPTPPVLVFAFDLLVVIAMLACEPKVKLVDFGHRQMSRAIVGVAYSLAVFAAGTAALVCQAALHGEP